MKKSMLFLTFSLLISFSSSAQIEYIFAAAKEDAKTYVENYMAPAVNGIMYDLNSGWYSRAKTHKLFGFDLTFTASLAIIPDSEKSFQFNEADYKNLVLKGGDGKIPTIAGSKTDAVLEASVEGFTFDIDAIDGHGDKWLKEFFIPLSIPTPMVQAGIGLPFNTDLKVRFFPKTEREGISFSILGLGVKHSLSQYFIKEGGIFNVAALAAFSNIRVAYVPDSIEIPGSNQEIAIGINTYTAQVIAGINLKIVNFYAAYGYISGDTNLGVHGNYDFDVDDNGSTDFTVSDPLDLDFSIAGYSSTFGLRVNLGPAKVFASYSYQNYQSLTAGVAISLR